MTHISRISAKICCIRNAFSLFNINYVMIKLKWFEGKKHIKKNLYIVMKIVGKEF
jgi:hypothetical protein